MGYLTQLLSTSCYWFYAPFFVAFEMVPGRFVESQVVGAIVCREV